MYKYYIISFFAILLNTAAVKASTTRDSIGVENYKGKKLVIHQVVAKDTYYSIGRRYNVTPKDIMAFNDNKYLQIGVIIKVPTTAPFGEYTPVVSAKNNTVPVNGGTSADGNLIEHAVQRKENLNMLAEKYGTTVNEIKRINNLSSINLQIGQILKIPAKDRVNEPVAEAKPTDQPAQQVNNQKPAVVAAAGKKEPVKVVEKTVPEKVIVDDKKADEEFIEHTVASNETIYSIASRYKLTMDHLKAKNNLADNSLTVGQKLLIKGQYPKKPAYTPPPVTPHNNTDTLNSIKDPLLKHDASRYGLTQVEEKGTAIWISDPDLDPSKMLILHRTAPIGRVIKITNPMSNRTTFAKVVGKFTENESTKDVIIVMTKAVADALGALDKRFYCTLTYNGQENEQ